MNADQGSAVAERADSLAAARAHATAMSALGPDRPVEEMSAAELRQLVGHLREAVDRRHVIGMAKGLIMASERVAGERAFDILRRASNNQNVPVSDLAEWIVARHDDEWATKTGPARGRAPRLEPRKP